MLRLRFAALVAALFAAAPASAQDAEEVFREGVALLDQGRPEDALKAFKRVLALNPSHEEAWRLWSSTEHEVWMRLLLQGGEIEQTAVGLMRLASAGRRELSDDPEAIRALIKDVLSEDVLVRNRAIARLQADHGEYAVPYMIYLLADRDHDDKRVAAMSALSRMGDDVVLPLIETLEAPDAYLRRNVAYTLGHIGDSRAAAALARLAKADPDTTVRKAAQDALRRVGGAADPVAKYLDLGAQYYAEDDSVLPPHRFSDVVWKWQGGKLTSYPVPRFLYGPELAKKAYFHALALDPSSRPALAGIARSIVAQRGRLDEWKAGGGEVGDWFQRLESDDLAVQVAGADALDTALGFALDQGDALAASGLARVLGDAASRATPNLGRALQSDSSGAVRGEAAVALARIATRAHQSASPECIAALAEAAARRVLRIGAIIDPDSARRERLASELTAEGMLVNRFSNGGRGIAGLRVIPHVDVILVADPLPDLTFHEVVRELKSDPRTADVPVLAIASESDASLFGDSVEGVISNGDVSVVEAALSKELGGDRARAHALGARAAEALRNLALSGTDVGPAADALAGTLADRPDDVLIPALETLAYVGQAEHVPAVLEVLAGDASLPVRLAAADALSGIFGRIGQVDGESLDTARRIALGEAPIEVRRATARALGRLELSPEMRVELMTAVLGS